jgi:dsRNA-specific ribonuclease
VFLTRAPLLLLADNYEVLETLGDSFLKLAVSTHLYMNNPNATEGQYAVSPFMIAFPSIRRVRR